MQTMVCLCYMQVNFPTEQHAGSSRELSASNGSLIFLELMRLCFSIKAATVVTTCGRRLEWDSFNTHLTSRYHTHSVRLRIFVAFFQININHGARVAGLEDRLGLKIS